MKELLSYLDRNGFVYDVSPEGIITIDGDTYELSQPNRDGYFFDRGFNYVGEAITANNYIYKFGASYYRLKRGDETNVKLNLLKYIGKVNSSLPTYAFLGVHGPFELLNGSGNYRDWCNKAKFFGVQALGICEKNTLAGVLKFQIECEKAGIKTVIGETVTVFNEKKDLRYDIKLYVENEAGWLNLLSINKIINVEDNSRIKEESLLSLLDGLIVVLDPKSLPFEDVPSVLKNGTYYQLDSVVFDNDIRDQTYLLNLQKYFVSALTPTSICDAYYLDQEYYHLKRVLNAMAKVSNDPSKNQYFKCNEEYVMEIKDLFSDNDQELMFDVIEYGIQNTDTIAQRCNFKIDTSKRHLPRYKMTPEQVASFKSKEELLLSLLVSGLKEKQIPEKQLDGYLERLETEIDVIKYGDVVDYFLILWDIVGWCKANNILVGFGRGSGCGSLVAYLLNLTHIDPFAYDLLFERFLNKGRVQSSLPDLDTDFEMAKRNQVKQYMESRYGQDQVCSVGTYTTLQVKAAVKDLCRLESISIPEVESFTSKFGVADKGINDLFKIACQKKDVANFVNKYPHIIEMVGLLYGQPKAKSIHACAMMIYPDERDMFHWAPTRKQADMYISEWEGGELDSAGFLKEDILGILQLSKFGDILRLIEENEGKKVDIYNLPLDDEKVYSYFQKGLTGDVFHFGAKGLTGYCKMLKPDNITELVNCIGLYRPGVMESNFHNEYILRKQGEREYDSRVGADEILKDTRYIMIWQEQTMKMFQVLGGFNLVDADSARRAIGKKNAEKLLPYKDKFLEHYMQHFGVDQKYAEEAWKEIEAMSTYQFNKSHAVAYANTGYACQWLKVHYPLEYWSTAFAYADDDDYPLYLHEINEIGVINIVPPDINESTDKIKTDFKSNSLFWSISSVKQVGEKAQLEIMKERTEGGVYFSLSEFLDRHSQKGSAVNKSVVENLISCGAFDKLENIGNPAQRMSLINFFRANNKVKVDKDKDVFSNTDKLGLVWWHNLRQKRLCGLAFFDYAQLYVNYFKEMSGEFFPFKNFSDIVDEPIKNSQSLSVGGYVYEITIRNSRKGEYAMIILEQNYQFRTVIFWSEEYETFSHLLKESKGNILFMSGKTNWDERNSQTVIYATQDTEVLILT